MANNLRYYRIKHGLSVWDLCKQVYGNKNHNTIFIHEMKHLTPKAAFKYAEVLGENVFDLLGEDALALKPTTQADKERLLKIVENIKVDE